MPTRDEMREIELSSRFYHEGGATYMTAFIVHNIETVAPTGSTVTFILSGNALVTVRYAEPKAFAMFLQRVTKGDASCASGAAILIGLIETLIERKADLVELIQDRADVVAQAVFDISGRGARASASSKISSREPARRATRSPAPRKARPRSSGSCTSSTRRRATGTATRKSFSASPPRKRTSPR